MVVLQLPSHLLTLAAREEPPTATAGFNPPTARSDDRVAGREECRSRIEDCRLGVAGEELAHIILLCIAELALGALNSGGALFRNLTEIAGKETWDIIAML